MSRLLLTIFGAIALICGYLYWGENMYNLMLPAGIGGGLFIVTWVMQHQIDWAWYSRNPPKLPAPMKSMFEKSSVFFRNLSEEEKIKFGTRTTLYVKAKDFIGQGQKEVAEDLKYIVAFYAVLLTWNKENLEYKEYDRIIFYLHPFLTPNHNEHVHTYEVEHEDGAIILSVDELVMGFLSPDKYYQTGLHATAEAFLNCYPSFGFPKYDENIWNDLETISTVSIEKIEDHIGLKQEDPRPVVVHHYISYAEKFSEVLPELYHALVTYFGHESSIKKG